MPLIHNDSALAGVVPIPLGNIELAYDAAGERLVFVVGVSEARRKAAAPSSSGKSRILASTHGLIPVEIGGLPDGIKVQITVTLPKA